MWLVGRCRRAARVARLVWPPLALAVTPTAPTPALLVASALPGLDRIARRPRPLLLRLLLLGRPLLLLRALLIRAALATLMARVAL